MRVRDSITARAAEAAWRATIPAVDDKGIGWDEMASHTRDVFRTMARAVIDALGLTEEWNVQTDGRPHLEPMEGPPSDVMRERLAAINSKSEYHRTFVSRLVTPWEEQ